MTSGGGKAGGVEPLSEEKLRQKVVDLYLTWGNGELAGFAQSLITALAACQAETEVWKPYEYDLALRTIVPAKVKDWLDELRAEVAALREALSGLAPYLLSAKNALDAAPRSAAYAERVRRMEAAARELIGVMPTLFGPAAAAMVKLEAALDGGAVPPATTNAITGESD